MSDKKEMTGEQMLLFLWRQIAELQAGELAMMRIISEISSHLSTEQLSILTNYPKYKDEAYERALIDLESRNPSLAAALDESRPLPPPDDKAS